MKQHRRRVTPTMFEQSRMRLKAGPFVTRVPFLQLSTEQARAGNLRYRGDGGQTNCSHRRMAFRAQRHPIETGDVADQLPTNRHTHSVDHDHQDGHVSCQRRNDFFQDLLHTDGRFPGRSSRRPVLQ